MNHFKRLASVAAAATLTLGGALAVSAPAQAVSYCPNGNFCGFNDINYSLAQGGEYNPSSTGCEPVISTPNQWSSLWNSSGRAVRVYKGPGCTGDSWLIANGSGDAHLSINATHFLYENNIESYRWS
jgi:hypothetical protein